MKKETIQSYITVQNVERKKGEKKKNESKL